MNPMISFNFTISDYSAKTPIQGATLKACAKTDTMCTTPLDTQMTDATGTATFSFNAGASGFDGYIDASGVASHEPTLIFFSHHVIGNPSVPQLAYGTLLFSTGIFNAATAIAKVTLDPMRGHVVNVARDCAYMPAAGATGAASAADGMSKTVYASGPKLDPMATQTDVSGATNNLIIVFSGIRRLRTT
jgi:hypothetical protein